MKPKILFNYGNAYIFHELIIPILPSLSNSFDISIVLSGDYISVDLKNKILLLKSEKVISNFFYFEDNKNIKLMYRNYLELIDFINDYKISIVIGISEIDDLSKLILNHCESKYCTLWSSLSYNVLDNDFTDRYNPNIERPWKEFKEESQQFLHFSPSLKQWILNNLKDKNLLNIISFFTHEVFKRVLLTRLSRFKKYLNEKKRQKILKELNIELPQTNEKGKISKISLGRSDLHLFVDSYEMKVMKAFLEKGDYKTIKYPTYGLKKSDLNNSKKLLFILTTGYSDKDKLSREETQQLLKEITTLMNFTKTSEVDFKPHPREVSLWPENLVIDLEKEGIKANILPKQIPFREIIEDYGAISGFASSSFRDLANQNPNLQVIGIERISIPVGQTIVKGTNFNIPRWFGYSEGISWLRIDGEIHKAPPINTEVKTLGEEIELFLRSSI